VAGTGLTVPLLGRGRAGEDLRPREYVVHGEHVITADSMVVLVDLAIRFDHEPDRDGLTRSWDPADEAALHAVAIATLRVSAEAHDRDAVVAERTVLAGPVERAVRFAPVATHWTPRVTSLEVRPHEQVLPSPHEFRIAR
jgi:hypothetical protein